MSPTVAFILALLATHAGQKVNLQIEKDDAKWMLKCEEYLHQEMIWLLQDIEGNSGIMEALLCSALEKQWLLWVGAAALVLVLAMGCCLVRSRKRGSASRRRQAGSSSKEEQGLPSTKVLQELVDELLAVCRVLSQRNFTPELHPAAVMDTSPTACSVQENSSTYRTLVILRPPPGHYFSLESTKRPPARHIRVALECLCSGEQLLGHRCFLHASGGQLPRDQEWYLMDTLCTGSYSDPEKVTRWVQTLLASTWLLLPHSHHCQLTALPSGKSCSFWLSGAFGLHCSIEMALAVQRGSSGAYLSPE
ncbi:inositol 1,4,5-trisphosphate receptor-interacting protein-like 1 isoform X1 [Anomalospiza imberbis]|uniref:inositol 1,4,5-trisphosphate receptor-interacting protein-like 1 isoform X1 n=1 Tax=Anomalospiza imberbis TaxID=187417 RepID=UPI00358E188A